MQNLARIRRVSRAMTHLCTASLVAIPVTLALVWANFDLFLAPQLANLPIAADGPPGWSLVVGYLVSLTAALAIMYGLWRLRRLFALYATGQIFTLENASCLRGFAWALVVTGAVKPVAGTVLSVVLTIGNPPGQRALAISFGSNEISVIFLGGVLLVTLSALALTSLRSPVASLETSE